MYEIDGKIHVKGEVKQVTDSFAKRQLVINTEGDYPNFNDMQLVQDKCELLDDFKVGDLVKVYFNLRGRAWESPSGETKYFNSLDVWKIESLADGESLEVAKPNESKDDLPF